ncbi:basic phospholipase A2 PA-12A-like [Branchiostoma floridae x Branchiostoma belcheri]
MKAIFIAATLLGVIYLTVGAPHRARRNLLQFAGMIRHATGRGALAYNGYGCYCGMGGSGTPVDGIDRCCRTHDRCYRRLVDEGQNPYTKTYSWRRRSGGAIRCNDHTSTSDYRTCACDRSAAYCFRRQTYNGKRNCEGQFSSLNPSGVYWAR